MIEEIKREISSIDDLNTEEGLISIKQVFKILDKHNKQQEFKWKCDICGYIYEEEELTDTEGMVNGSIGYLCEQCMEDNDVGR